MKKSLVLFGFLASLVGTVLTTPVPVFRATALGPPGTVVPIVVFEAASDTLAYAGEGRGLTPNLGDAACTAPNACTIQIFSGPTCADPGSPLFVGQQNPWLRETYTTNADGQTTFNGIVRTGNIATSIEGLPIILFAENGTQIACGPLISIPPDATQGTKILTVDARPLDARNVEASVTASVGFPTTDSICFYGIATGLTPNINGGQDCVSAFACETTVHEGTDCANPSNPFYDTDDFLTSPWDDIGYESSNADGVAEFVHCVKNGISPSSYELQPFIVYNVDGSQAACGIIGREVAPSPPPTAAPRTPPPTSNPTATPEPTSTFAPTSSTQSPTTLMPTTASDAVYWYSDSWRFVMGFVTILVTGLALQSL